jgi:hypothetical protein
MGNGAFQRLSARARAWAAAVAVAACPSGAGCAEPNGEGDVSAANEAVAAPATSSTTLATPPIVTRQDAIKVMNEIDDEIVQMDRSEGQVAGDFNALAALSLNLGTVAARLLQAASSSPGASPALLAATQQMQEAQLSFNLQYLQLQTQMQNENRSYTTVSNIMKTKHDTVKNSISNIR